MIKSDIVKCVAEKVHFSNETSFEIVEFVFEAMKQTLEQGENIKISGFGNFIVRDKKSRIGRNPHSGEAVEITARRVLTFRPSQTLNSALNPEKQNKVSLQSTAKNTTTARPFEGKPQRAIQPKSAGQFELFSQTADSPKMNDDLSISAKHAVPKSRKRNKTDLPAITMEEIKPKRTKR